MSACKNECGRPVQRPWSGECDACYKRRTRREGTIGRGAHILTHDTSYAQAHKRVRRYRGKASEHPCISCGEVALEWSYRRGSDRELSETLTLKGTTYTVQYSPVADDYDPRCKPCHVAYDARPKENTPWLSQTS